MGWEVLVMSAVLGLGSSAPDSEFRGGNRDEAVNSCIYMPILRDPRFALFRINF